MNIHAKTAAENMFSALNKKVKPTTQKRKQTCPHCGKKVIHLNRHLKNCKGIVKFE